MRLFERKMVLRDAVPEKEESCVGPNVYKSFLTTYPDLL
jgi:hypothetical protein